MHQPQLYTGAPENGSRSEREEACYRLLDSLGIVYTRVDHDPAMTMEQLVSVGSVLGCEVAKNLFLTNRQCSRFYLLIMPGGKPFKTKYLSSQLGCSRLSFASEEHLERLLGVKSGSASVLALKNAPGDEVQLVLDRELLDCSDFACHPCINTSTLAFSTEALLHKLLPALGFEPAFAELPREFES